ncbi:MAG: guanylate kinase [Pseudomonadota bacterium]
MSERGQLILVSAPSGAGKTSLVQAALQQDATVAVSVSHTTRPQRANEQDGVNYHFVDDTRFRQMIDAGEFLEHAVVFGNLYGTSRSEIEQLNAAGRDVILEIDWQGAAQVRNILPHAKSIFILPPSIDTLQQRLHDRGQDDADTIRRRLGEAQLDMSQAADYDYIVINDDFDVALRAFTAILQAGRCEASRLLAHSNRVQALVQSER